MFDTGTAMPAFTKDPYLIYEITLLQKVLFLIVYKDIVPTTICMKSSIFTAVVLLLAAFKPCLTTKAEAVPACIQQRIEEIKKEPKWNPPAEVHEYIYNGKKVYYFSSNCCDQYNTVYDSVCNYICAPSGGYSGEGDKKCPDFKANAQHVRLIWKDER
jgi:hypothetical protein